MDATLSSGVLSGRPFGGIAILLRDSIAVCTKLLFSSARCIVCIVGDIIVCNVYLPCASTTSRVDICADVLSSISVCCDSISYTSAIMCGDFNCSLDYSDTFTSIINDFCSTFPLVRTDSSLDCNNRFTFHTSDYTATSLIDHFLVSPSLFDHIHRVEIIDSGINLSDHCPIACILSVNLVLKPRNNTASAGANGLPTQLLYRLRWD
jgi:exonuclease III